MGVSFSSMAGSVNDLERTNDAKALREMRISKLKIQVSEKALRRTVSFDLDESGGKGPKTCKNGAGSCKVK